MSEKVHTVRTEYDLASYAIPTDAFDRMVDDGYDAILIVARGKRYYATVDDWLDYSYIDIRGDEEVRVLNRSYMGRV